MGKLSHFSVILFLSSSAMLVLFSFLCWENYKPIYLLSFDHLCNGVMILIPSELICLSCRFFWVSSGTVSGKCPVKRAICDQWWAQLISPLSVGPCSCQWNSCCTMQWCNHWECSQRCNDIKKCVRMPGAIQNHLSFHRKYRRFRAVLTTVWMWMDHSIEVIGNVDTKELRIKMK